MWYVAKPANQRGEPYGEAKWIPKEHVKPVEYLSADEERVSDSESDGGLGQFTGSRAEKVDLKKAEGDVASEDGSDKAGMSSGQKRSRSPPFAPTPAETDVAGNAQAVFSFSSGGNVEKHSMVQGTRFQILCESEDHPGWYKAQKVVMRVVGEAKLVRKDFIELDAGYTQQGKLSECGGIELWRNGKPYRLGDIEQKQPQSGNELPCDAGAKEQKQPQSGNELPCDAGAKEQKQPECDAGAKEQKQPERGNELLCDAGAKEQKQPQSGDKRMDGEKMPARAKGRCYNCQEWVWDNQKRRTTVDGWYYHAWDCKK